MNFRRAAQQGSGAELGNYNFFCFSKLD